MTAKNSEFAVLKTSFLILTVLVGIWLTGGIIFSLLTYFDKSNAEKSDAIIVLTGGAQRIETALMLLLDGKADELFISGVNKGNTLADMLAASTLDDTQKQAVLNHCCITLDFASLTTAQNAVESAQWVKEHGFKSVILVTSDYHVIRAALHFYLMLPQKTKIQTYPVISRKNIFDSIYWQNVFTEYHKSLVTAIYAFVRLTRNSFAS